MVLRDLQVCQDLLAFLVTLVKGVHQGVLVFQVLMDCLAHPVPCLCYLSALEVMVKKVQLFLLKKLRPRLSFNKHGLQCGAQPDQWDLLGDQALWAHLVLLVPKEMAAKEVHRVLEAFKVPLVLLEKLGKGVALVLMELEGCQENRDRKVTGVSMAFLAYLARKVIGEN